MNVLRRPELCGTIIIVLLCTCQVNAQGNGALDLLLVVNNIDDISSHQEDIIQFVTALLNELTLSMDHVMVGYSYLGNGRIHTDSAQLLISSLQRRMRNSPANSASFGNARHHLTHQYEHVPRDYAPDCVVYISQGFTNENAEYVRTSIEPLARILIAGTRDANWENLNQYNSHPEDRFTIDQVAEILQVLYSIMEPITIVTNGVISTTVSTTTTSTTTTTVAPISTTYQSSNTDADYEVKSKSTTEYNTGTIIVIGVLIGGLLYGISVIVIVCIIVVKYKRRRQVTTHNNEGQGNVSPHYEDISLSTVHVSKSGYVVGEDVDEKPNYPKDETIYDIIADPDVVKPDTSEKDPKYISLVNCPKDNDGHYGPLSGLREPPGNSQYTELNVSNSIGTNSEYSYATAGQATLPNIDGATNVYSNNDTPQYENMQ